MQTHASVWSTLQKLIFGNDGQNLRKSRYQSFQVLSNFASFSDFRQNVLSMISGIYSTNIIKRYKSESDKNIITGDGFTKEKLKGIKLTKAEIKWLNYENWAFLGWFQLKKT